MGLPAGLRKRGRMFYVQHRDATGKWKSQSVGPDLEVALRRHAELRAGEPIRTGPALADVVPSWLESQRTRCKPRSIQISDQRSKGLVRRLGDVQLMDLTSEHVDALVRARRADGVKDTSINGDLTTLRQIVRYAEAVGLIDKAPRIKLLRVVKKGRRKTYGSDDVAKLLKAAKERPGAADVRMKLQGFIMISAATGLRYEEVLHLQWRDVDFTDGRFDVRAKTWTERRRGGETIRSWSPKSHAERSVWAQGEVLFGFLNSYRKSLKRSGPNDWVFQGMRPGARLTTMFKALRETYQAAGVYERGKLAHTLRHSVATELLAAGVDLETVRDVLGHRDITTTALYLHAVDQRKREAAARLKLVG
jgi:integrase